ncbi:MAG: GNAT family N-acetyltransferase [Bdellovibrionota bacterium]
MPIKTDRLLLKPRREGEGKAIADAVEESLNELSPWMPAPKNYPNQEQAEIRVRRDMAEYLLRTSCTLSIYSPDGKTFLGTTGFHRINWDIGCFEIGYWIRTSFAGKGLVTEAVNAQTQYLFKVLDARRVEIRCDVRNLASQAIMKKLGFGVEAVLRRDEVDESGTPRDTAIAARFDTEGLPEIPGLSW